MYIYIYIERERCTYIYIYILITLSAGHLFVSGCFRARPESGPVEQLLLREPCACISDTCVLVQESGRIRIQVLESESICLSL